MIYLDEAIRERHSVRNFRDKVVPDKAILQILEAGRLAPSAKNRQPWRFEVVGSIHKNEISDLMKKRANEIYRADSTVATSAEIVRDAPVLNVTEGCFYGCCELEEIIASPKLEGLEENSFLTCPKINIDLCGYRYRNGKAIMKKS